MAEALTRAGFTAALRGLSVRYWDTHPFQLRLHEGRCTQDEVRSWVANRWYYQRCLSQKNGAIIANCPLPAVRRRWAERILFQDGRDDGEGGLEDWLVLAEAVGLSREEVREERHVLPGVRFAVDSYVHFCRTRPWIEGVAAGLTELFAPGHMADRIAAWQRHYPWIKPEGYAYFATRIPVVEGDAEYTLGLVLDHCATREQQDRAVAALGFKCDVLRGVLDAVEYAAGRPAGVR
ncbi:pyrroloquinoline-quinone synthase PqqC [Streptomyces sp. TRM 70361]|uniref:pyrroloquinoline-quinone synthase PqqC n=1 Tax=Streptomyces sp. TRM 70361 TaxID=3116553 RepID=UPI002E7C13CE|nr:pyrroloquinoline-quinone synthase PqqC [Streptomyces sp. TRM 70361]MEE1942821.1 pyrroloquinoline-quinone synthase PqqC [Streptomyces sp. TRM 70361]